MNKKILFTAYVFLVYILVWYFPGFVFSSIYESYFNNYYNNLGGLNIWHLIWFILILSFIFINYLLLSYLMKVKLQKLPVKLTRSLIFVLVLFFLILSLMFSFSYDSSFRHTSRLSESDFWVSLLWFVKPLIYVIALVIYIQGIENSRLNAFSFLIGGFIVVGCILSITSSMEVFVPIILIFLFYQINFSINPIKKEFNVFKLLIIFLLLVPVGVLAVLTGLGSKLGYDVVFDINLMSVFNVLSDEFEFLIPRFSTASASFIYWVNNEMKTDVELYSLWSSVNHTFTLRFCLIFEKNCISSDFIDTVNRHNYLTVFAHHAERAGASPGPLASVFLVGNSISGLFLLSIFFGWIISLISKIITYKKKISLVYYIFIPLFVMPFFESPLDIFYIFEPLTLQFIFFTLFLLFVDFDKTFLNE